MAARRGEQRATDAVGHTILRVVSQVVKDPGSVDAERGAHDGDARARQARQRDVVRRLQRLGNTVVLQPLGVT